MWANPVVAVGFQRHPEIVDLHHHDVVTTTTLDETTAAVGDLKHHHLNQLVVGGVQNENRRFF